MNVEFTKTFNKSLDKLKDKKVLKAVSKAVDEIIKAKDEREIPHLKKLSGHKTAYRVRIKDYRIGIYIEKGTIEFAEIAHRKDIYNMFP